jgi:hypothetical protein
MGDAAEQRMGMICSGDCSLVLYGACGPYTTRPPYVAAALLPCLLPLLPARPGRGILPLRQLRHRNNPALCAAWRVPPLLRDLGRSPLARPPERRLAMARVSVRRPWRCGGRCGYVCMCPSAIGGVSQQADPGCLHAHKICWPVAAVQNCDSTVTASRLAD